MQTDNYFKLLNDINVNGKTEKKNGLTYLSWAWAWGEVKKLFPDATYTIYENEAGWNYHTDGRTAWVKTGCTVNGIEHIEYLPVMDFKNRSIPLDNITSFDVNKAIQRSLTKALARHGLGLYIYAGEDLPESETPTKAEKTFEITLNGENILTGKKSTKFTCNLCKKEMKPVTRKDGSTVSLRQWEGFTTKHFGQPICLNCLNEHYPDWTQHADELT